MKLWQGRVIKNLLLNEHKLKPLTSNVLGQNKSRVLQFMGTEKQVDVANRGKFELVFCFSFT